MFFPSPDHTVLRSNEAGSHLFLPSVVLPSGGNAMLVDFGNVKIIDSLILWTHEFATDETVDRSMVSHALSASW